MIHYSRWFVLRTGQVHWGRVHPDYHGKRWLATACGWATPYEGLLMETTDLDRHAAYSVATFVAGATGGR